MEFWKHFPYDLMGFRFQKSSFKGRPFQPVFPLVQAVFDLRRLTMRRLTTEVVDVFEKVGSCSVGEPQKQSIEKNMFFGWCVCCPFGLRLGCTISINFHFHQVPDGWCQVIFFYFLVPFWESQHFDGRDF